MNSKVQLNVQLTPEQYERFQEVKTLLAQNDPYGKYNDTSTLRRIVLEAIDQRLESAKNRNG